MGIGKGGSKSRHSLGARRRSYSSWGNPLLTKDPSRITRSVTAAQTAEEARAKMEAGVREQNRLSRIKEEHAVHSNQSDILKNACWFMLELNRFKTQTEIEAKIKELMEKTKTKSIRYLILLRRRFLRAIQVLKNLSINNVGDIPLNQLLPDEKSERSFKDSPIFTVDSESSGELEKKRLNDDIEDKFNKQVKLGIDALNNARGKFPKTIIYLTKKNSHMGGKGTKKRKNI